MAIPMIKGGASERRAKPLPFDDEDNWNTLVGAGKGGPGDWGRPEWFDGSGFTGDGAPSAMLLISRELFA